MSKKTAQQRQYEQTVDKFRTAISDLEDILKLMPLKGNTSSECQRTGIQIQINELDSYVSGITLEDFTPNEYSQDFELSYS